jgi:hypothetical protein
VATTRNITRIVALRTGLPFEHVQEIAYGLKQAGAWGGSCSQAITFLLLALAADANPKSAASIAKHYYDLVDDDYAASAGQMIEDMVSTFLEHARTPFSQWAYQSRIEVYSGTPAVRIQTPCNDGETFELTYVESHDADAWQATTVRCSTIITGKALFDIAADLNLVTAHV